MDVKYKNASAEQLKKGVELVGFTDNNELIGGKGKDTLVGGDGDDIIRGGKVIFENVTANDSFKINGMIHNIVGKTLS